MNHDQFFKTLLRQFLADFFQVFYPSWANRFRFDQAEWLEQEVFPAPPHGEKLIVDILVKLPTIPSDPPRGNEPRESLALILIEPESSTSLTAFRARMYDYVEAVRRKYDLDVLPIAIFINIRMDGLSTDVENRMFWERRILTFEYDYVAIPGLNAEDYAQHANPFANAWSTVMNMEQSRRAQAAVDAMDRVADSPIEIEKKHLLLDFIQSYTPLDDSQRRDLNQLLIDPKHERVLAMGKTWKQEGFEEGLAIAKTWRQEGFEEGVALGKTWRQEGKQEGQRELLCTMFLNKFPQISRDVVNQKIEHLSLEEINAMCLKLLTATSPNELGFES